MHLWAAIALTVMVHDRLLPAFDVEGLLPQLLVQMKRWRGERTDQGHRVEAKLGIYR